LHPRDIGNPGLVFVARWHRDAARCDAVRRALSCPAFDGDFKFLEIAGILDLDSKQEWLLVDVRRRHPVRDVPGQRLAGDR
jgi:hypothetical protein